MLVVHALWSPGRGPLIWGEDGDRPVKSSSQAVRSAREHPFAADAAVLADVHAGKPTAATVLLPSLRMSPLDSAELVRARPRPAPQRPPALLPWVVPALLVDPTELAEESPRVRYGVSVQQYLDKYRAVVLMHDLGDTIKIGPRLDQHTGAAQCVRDPGEARPVEGGQ